MIFPGWMDRTRLLLGDDKLEKLANAHILVVGLGGVGGYAAEMLCRAGIGNLTIVDGDTIHESNLNRQIIATSLTVGMSKTAVMKDRLLSINPKCKITDMPVFLRDKEMIDLLENSGFDYVIDAIDTLSPKVFLIYYSLKNNLKIVSSMGSGGKLSPDKIHIDDISKTKNCPLARMVRKRLHKLGVYSGFKVIYSSEFINDKSVLECDEPNKKTTTGTISYMPAIFGCMAASVAICHTIGYCE